MTTTREDMRALLDERRAEFFRRIYLRNEWNGRGGTRSGPGSSLVATERLREVLPQIMVDLEIGSILDAGCGDSLWMPSLPGYVGVDIVEQAVKIARERHPERSYATLDICADVLPKCEAIICRDAMQHMSMHDGLAALENFRASGAEWFFAASHRGTENESITTGGYYQINLEAAPFSLGEPLLEIPDGDWENELKFPHKMLGLWALAS